MASQSDLASVDDPTRPTLRFSAVSRPFCPAHRLAGRRRCVGSKVRTTCRRQTRRQRRLCQPRSPRPAKRALTELRILPLATGSASVSRHRRECPSHRQSLPLVQIHADTPKLKIDPLAESVHLQCSAHRPRTLARRHLYLVRRLANDPQRRSDYRRPCLAPRPVTETIRYSHFHQEALDRHCPSLKMSARGLNRRQRRVSKIFPRSTQTRTLSIGLCACVRSSPAPGF